MIKTVLLLTTLFAVSVSLCVFIGCEDGTNLLTLERECLVTSNAFTDEDGYWMGWDHCVSHPLKEKVYYAKYFDGPYQGKVYRAYWDAAEGKYYIQREGRKVYIVG